MNSDHTFCPANMTSCYHYSTATATYTAAASACQALGGNVVSWNTDPEQFMVGLHCLPACLANGLPACRRVAHAVCR